jgi:hypothetical protein
VRASAGRGTARRRTPINACANLRLCACLKEKRFREFVCDVVCVLSCMPARAVAAPAVRARSPSESRWVGDAGPQNGYERTARSFTDTRVPRATGGRRAANPSWRRWCWHPPRALLRFPALAASLRRSPASCADVCGVVSPAAGGGAPVPWRADMWRCVLASPHTRGARVCARCSDARHAVCRSHDRHARADEPPPRGRGCIRAHASDR